MRDTQQIPAVALAFLLHVLVLGSFVFAFDWSRRHPEPLPLAMTATLVSADEPVRPPVVEQPPPEPEPEPEEAEPEPEPEPEEPPPDPAAEARAKAEEQARLEELRREQQRQQAEERARLQRIEEEKEAERRAQEEARRKAEEEAERERQRVEAERRRKEEEERQRAENERLRREAESRQLQEQIEAEERRLAARSSEDMAAYQFAIQQKVRRAWIKPASAPRDLDCEVHVRQDQNGNVLSVQVVSCNGDAIVVRSIETAVRKASPLPKPPNPLLFDADLIFDFVPGDQ